MEESFIYELLAWKNLFAINNVLTYNVKKSRIKLIISQLFIFCEYAVFKLIKREFKLLQLRENAVNPSITGTLGVILEIIHIKLGQT